MKRRPVRGRHVAIAERISSRQLLALGKDVLAHLSMRRERYGECETLLHDALALRMNWELFQDLPRTLDGLSELATRLESYEEAARIIGVAQRARADLGTVPRVPDQERLGELEHVLRAALGAEAFQAARDQGANLTVREAIAWLRRMRGERKRPARGWEEPHPHRTEGGRACRRGAHEPSDRRALVHLPGDREGPPLSHLRQARDLLPRRSSRPERPGAPPVTP